MVFPVITSPTSQGTPPNHHAQNPHRTLPHQEHRAHPHDQPRRARAAARGRPPQRLQAARRGRADRLADRLRHRCHVQPTMGRDHGGRRELRRRAQLLPAGGRDPEDHRHEVLRAHPPGPRGREGAVHRRLQEGRPGAQQLPLRHHARQPRIHRCRCARPGHRRRPAAGADPPLQGQHRPGARGGAAEGAGRSHPVRHDHRDQQHRRRPAGVDGQHPRLRGAAEEARQALHHGCLPLLGKRHVHQDARAGLREHADPRHRARKCSATPTAPP